MTVALTAVLALASAPQEIAITLAARSQQPGELLVATLTTDAQAREMRVRVFGQLMPVFQVDKGKWQSVVGVDIGQRPGVYSLVAEARVGSELVSGRYELRILRKRFPTRRLVVAPEFVDPPPSMRDRIERETAFLADVYAHSALERLWHGAFVRPVPDPATSRFGTRSIFNGRARSPHAGADFLSVAGARVRAPNAGRIVVARDLYFSGGTVVIDHGLGVFSLLAHLSQIDVKEEQDIDAGAVVGLVGATGRVTGPHLHWALRVAGARIDPLSALELLGDAAPNPP
ncbi:MAG: M23 family metallopeptidase [Vicinamibacterales bacterium]